MSKQFPESMKCDDAMLKETGGSPVLLKALWNKFPAIRNEFSDYAAFEAYAQSVAAGKSQVYGRATVVSSRESDHTSLAARG